MSRGRKRLGLLCGAFAVCTSLLVWPQIEPLGFAGTGLVGLAMMALLGGGMLAIIVGLLGSKSWFWQVGLVAVAAVMVSFFLSAVIVLRQRCVSYERGDEIVAALEACHDREGRFPETLEQLSAVGMSRVPRPAVGLIGGRSFRYQVRGAANFFLSFDVPLYFGAGYSREEGHWRIHD